MQEIFAFCAPGLLTYSLILLKSTQMRLLSCCLYSVAMAFSIRQVKAVNLFHGL